MFIRCWAFWNACDDPAQGPWIPSFVVESKDAATAAAVTHLLDPCDAVSLGHEAVGKLAVRYLRKPTVRLLSLHVDEVKLLHPDVCIDVKQLVELADLRKK